MMKNMLQTDEEIWRGRRSSALSWYAIETVLRSHLPLGRVEQSEGG